MAFFDRAVRPYFDKHFFEVLAEKVDAAFAASHFKAEHGAIALPSQIAYARGSERYFSVQRAVMEAAVEFGAEEVEARAGTFPLPLARHRRFLVATSITDSLEHLRRSKARRALAGLNMPLEPEQLDFWKKAPRSAQASLFGMILIAKGAPGSILPAGVFFGVPTSSLRSWHFYENILDLVNRYESKPLAAPKRMAPRLRATPKSAMQVKDQK